MKILNTVIPQFINIFKHIYLGNYSVDQAQMFIKTPRGMGTTVCPNGLGHITNMVEMLIYSARL